MKIRNTVTASALMILGALLLRFSSHVEDIHPNRPFASFPTEIDGWRGKTETFDQKIYDILGVDDSFLCDYRDDKNRMVQLYIGFYQSQREGDLIHSPKNCMPGAGWKITETRLREIRRFPDKPDRVKVIELTLENGPYKQAMLYWFHSRGRIISSEYMQKIYLVMDSILRHRTDGSFVRLIAPISGDDREKAFQDLTVFAEQIMPVLDEYIPE